MMHLRHKWTEWRKGRRGTQWEIVRGYGRVERDVIELLRECTVCGKRQKNFMFASDEWPDEVS